MNIRLEKSWHRALSKELAKPYFEALDHSIKTAFLNSPVLPPAEQIFNAFDLCPFDQVKVVILGQDPYHQIGQAHGLAFSVPSGIKVPPSLRNIYKELQSDLGIPIRETGNLETWAKQGVLLLNATLTVLPGLPGSHQKLGWEIFTDAVIKTISDSKDHVVFILWGNYARAKADLIDKNKHLILEAPHPSPLSAYSGFFGCRHFSQTNAWLKSQALVEISW